MISLAKKDSENELAVELDKKDLQGQTFRVAEAEQTGKVRQDICSVSYLKDVWKLVVDEKVINTSSGSSTWKN